MRRNRLLSKQIKTENLDLVFDVCVNARSTRTIAALEHEDMWRHRAIA